MAKILPMSKPKEWRLVQFDKGSATWFEVHQYGLINKDSSKLGWIPIAQYETHEKAIEGFNQIIAPVKETILMEV